ncbi:MAG: PQQ-dependent sugar dehydrogenase, partial [Sciscionella sp.]
VKGTPSATLQGKSGFGRLSALDSLDGRFALAGTVNKAGGTPVSSDDRVVVITPQSAGASPGQD